MKKVLLLSTLALASSTAFANSSYITGNLQFHSDNGPGTDLSSTLEAGHTFDNSLGGLTLYTEMDGIQLGEITSPDAVYWTLGGEQSFSLTDNLWVAVGYQHLLHEGESFQYRPLVKIGYNFDNGIQISNRTRAHIDAIGDADTDYRMDNRIAYAPNENLALSYNNVYMIDASVMDHELRATWTRSGVQPYFEYRNQGDNTNNAFVFGASYGF